MKSIIKQNLYKNPALEIRKSPVNGWGVFTRRDIKKDTVLEESPIIFVPSEKLSGVDECLTYCYNYDDETLMIPFGYAPMYNHSSTPNADWIGDYVNMTMNHYAIEDIPAGSEIFISYGSDDEVSF